ncbi:DUF4386 domain-containing protein [Candidatus Bathyarchaeota archaeon]|nr:MAG: DUF4386 domain-containing protein [Candidatus Bathyarchaeota archaeon]
MTRKTSTVVGILFIMATVTSILSGFFLGSFEAPDFLVSVAANENLVKQGMLVQIIWGLACLGIPVALHPILRKQNEALSMGFFSLRLIECIFVFVGVVCQLAVVSLSKEISGVVDSSIYYASGLSLLAVRDWAFWVGPSIAFALSAVILNYVLYKSRIVPRWVSGLGLFGALLYMPAEGLALFGNDKFMFLAAPIALQEMILAVWLIAKGFNSAAINSQTSQREAY